MDSLVISLAPVAIIAAYIWLRDKYEREPFVLLLLSLVAGALIVIPVMAVESVLSTAGENFAGWAETAWTAFVVAGFTEEMFKFIALFLLFWKRREFNEKYDGIVYATFISLGFAAVENVMYVFRDGYATGLLRAFTAVPAHAIFGITMGYYAGLAKFYPQKRKRYSVLALFIPVLLHGIYDFILMAGYEWLWIFFLAFVVYLYITGLKRMKYLSDHSYFRTDYELLNKKFSDGDT